MKNNEMYAIVCANKGKTVTVTTEKNEKMIGKFSIDEHELN